MDAFSFPFTSFSFLNSIGFFFKEMNSIVYNFIYIDRNNNCALNKYAIAHCARLTDRLNCQCQCAIVLKF